MGKDNTRSFIRPWTGFAIMLILGALIISGCKNDIEDIPEDEIPEILADCSGFENNLKNAIYGFNQGSVFAMQKANAIMKYRTCLQDAGLSEKQAEAIVDQKVEEYDKQFR